MEKKKQTRESEVVEHLQYRSLMIDIRPFCSFLSPLHPTLGYKTLLEAMHKLRRLRKTSLFPLQ
jgi:hypothetical protein